jgi:hypothetical protein
MPLLNTSVLLFSSSSSARTAQFLLVLALLGGAFGPLAPSPAIAQATWAEAIAGNSADRGRDLAVDDAGNSYVTGFFSDSPDFDGDGQADATSAGDYDIFVAKYNNAGTLQWVSTAGGSAGRDRGVGIALDDAGNSYVTGYFNGSADFDGDGQPEVTAVGGATDDDIFVAKYDDTGVLQWVRSAGSQFAPRAAATFCLREASLEMETSTAMAARTSRRRGPVTSSWQSTTAAAHSSGRTQQAGP